MKELAFNHGRLSFDFNNFEMNPCLPDKLESRIQFYVLDENGLTVRPFIDFDEIDVDRKSTDVCWLHLTGTLSDEFWKHLAKFMDLADEQLKLIRSPHHRSYLDEFHNGVFWTLQRPSVGDVVEAIEVVNFFMTDTVIVTRQFSHDAAFSITIDRLMARGDMLSNYTVDRLAAHLIEDVIRTYVEVLKVGGTKLETIQSRIIKHPGKEELLLINRAQQIIWIFLNTVWPLETVCLALTRCRCSVVTETGRRELGYCYDEATSVVRMFETYRSMSYNLMEVYVSGLGLRTNETTMILTVIATLFLPPTLIAGIYGMNFQIPEVHLTFGYYACLILMVMVSGGLLWWLKTRGFLDFR
jgi:magnesium transporter